MSSQVSVEVPEASLELIPAEMRNKIWHLTESLVPTLHHPTGNHFVDIDCVENQEHWQQGKARVCQGRIVFDTSGKYLPQPAITRVNRNLRKETLSIYYGNAKFYVPRYFGNQSGGLSRRYAVKWIESQCERLLLKGSILFGFDFDDAAVARALELLGPGVVCGEWIHLRSRSLANGESDKENEDPDVEEADEDSSSDEDEELSQDDEAMEDEASSL